MNLEPLAALANAVEAQLNCDYNFWGFEAPASLYDALRDCKVSCAYFTEKIHKKLYAVNIRAYNRRYNSHKEPADEEALDIDMRKYIIHHPPEYKEHNFAVRPWHFQLAKLLDFWLYQTAEDATHNDPLRLAMVEFRDNLYTFIIRNNPEYTNTQWSELFQSTTPKKEANQITRKKYEAKIAALEPLTEEQCKSILL